ncbi:lysine-2,3-aminomutase-like protein [Gemmobacter aquarius]|uniref:Lysine-2,3-aminomutase-like protein n=1 Tax=Paragemmobacter aquarius TaxID=2169400 RepID=A0A2S0UH69_9RHOB|nr:lysine-2,3-aminomutase-like protein [Gemmobacter aquarius]AWB47154.1 lysine-2,3-aminomutase-like protein [Gemmobacter aquarius]
MKAAVSLGDLVARGLVEAAEAPALLPVEQSFRIRLSGAMQGAIATRDDPVARQFIPSVQELDIKPDESGDPIGDEVHSPVKGLTHRYPDRVILHVTKTCEVYCRFCFRREAVGDEGHLSQDEIIAALDYVSVNPAIREVILTGGDPLVLSPRRIKDLVERIGAISTVDTLRIHTRVPVVAPERMTEALVSAFETRLTVILVLHANHAAEFTDAARAGLRAMQRAGIMLLSQSVLLRGVNDSLPALEELFREMLRCGVKPYYLHHCDLAKGVSHFRTTIADGMALMRGLRGKLAGPLIPTYVIDIAGGFGKVPITPDYVVAGATPGEWRITDWRGGVHDYRDPHCTTDAQSVQTILQKA